MVTAGTEQNRRQTKYRQAALRESCRGENISNSCQTLNRELTQYVDSVNLDGWLLPGVPHSVCCKLDAKWYNKLKMLSLMLILDAGKRSRNS